eukprot:Sspe_Gene.45505::Locus_22542_Transcript_1_2_Confidence_0.833_Length_3523::g.45505::m.45505
MDSVPDVVSSETLLSTHDALHSEKVEQLMKDDETDSIFLRNRWTGTYKRKEVEFEFLQSEQFSFPKRSRAVAAIGCCGAIYYFPPFQEMVLNNHPGVNTTSVLVTSVLIWLHSIAVFAPARRSSGYAFALPPLILEIVLALGVYVILSACKSSVYGYRTCKENWCWYSGTGLCDAIFLAYSFLFPVRIHFYFGIGPLQLAVITLSFLLSSDSQALPEGFTQETEFFLSTVFTTTVVYIILYISSWNQWALRRANWESSMHRNHVQNLINEQTKLVGLLLHATMPAVVVDRLVCGEHVIDRRNAVTVVFIDIVSFTNWSSTREATEVAQMLNILFKELDLLAQKHRIEKIKTVGDAYWAVSGLWDATDGSEEHAFHAFDAADFCLAAVKGVQILQIKEPLMGGISIRIGAHSGSVIAGVIGKAKFSYDVFGATNTIANELEARSQPLKILISDAMYKHVKDSYNCQYAGEFHGQSASMHTYYLTSPKEEARPVLSTDGSCDSLEGILASSGHSPVHCHRASVTSGGRRYVEDVESDETKSTMELKHRGTAHLSRRLESWDSQNIRGIDYNNKSNTRSVASSRYRTRLHLLKHVVPLGQFLNKPIDLEVRPEMTDLIRRLSDAPEPERESSDEDFVPPLLRYNGFIARNLCCMFMLRQPEERRYSRFLFKYVGKNFRLDILPIAINWAGTLTTLAVIGGEALKTIPVLLTNIVVGIAVCVVATVILLDQAKKRRVQRACLIGLHAVYALSILSLYFSSPTTGEAVVAYNAVLVQGGIAVFLPFLLPANVKLLLSLLYILPFAAFATTRQAVSSAVVALWYASPGIIFAVANEKGLRDLFLKKELAEFNMGKLKIEGRTQRQLLENTVPKICIPRLLDMFKNTENATVKPIVDKFTGCTVMFIKVCGVCTEEMLYRPPEMFFLLNAIYNYIDEALSRRQCLEKIKCVGDIILVVSGLKPVKRSGVAEINTLHTVAAAFEINQIVTSFLLKHPRVGLHVKEVDKLNLSTAIGIHYGDLVGAVVGGSRVLYDVFGDTVNTASRMMGKATQGHVRVTQSFYGAWLNAVNLLQPGDPLDEVKSAGPHQIEVKGKGTMSTYELYASTHDGFTGSPYFIHHDAGRQRRRKKMK